VALGLAGVLLLVFNWLGNVGLIQVAAVTLVLALLWTGAGLLVYRNYAASLLETMRRRGLDPFELALDNGSTLAVVEGLLASTRLGDVRLALDMLAGAEHPSLDGHLIRLAQQPMPQIQIEALGRIESRPVTAARPVVERLLADSGEPAVRGAALRALCAMAGAGAAPIARPYLTDPVPEMRSAAIVSLLSSGTFPDRQEERQELARWVAAGIQDRQLLAKAIGEAGRPDLAPVLQALLRDGDLGVRREALEAACRLALPDLLPQIVENLYEPATRSAAAEAMVSIGEPILPLVAAALEDTSSQSIETVQRLVRACGQMGGEPASALLRQHLAHPDADVRTWVQEALRVTGFCADQADRTRVAEAIRQESREATYALAAREDIGEGPEVAPLRNALDDEFRLARQRVFLLLGFLYDTRAIARAEQLLVKGNGAEKALALEMMDVALASEHKALALPLVDPGLDTTQRLRQLQASSLSRVDRLREILEDAEGRRTRPWVQACAVYAAGKLDLPELAGPVAALLRAEDPTVRETAAWAMARLRAQRDGWGKMRP
jgi:HEAT repeat protein